MYQYNTTTPIGYLKGVGPKKAELLENELNIRTIGDLIHHYPYRYIDKKKVVQINQLNAHSGWVLIKGTLSTIKTIGQHRKKRLSAQLKDSSGKVELLWFRSAVWIEKTLQNGTLYEVYGKINGFNGSLSIAHPEMTIYDPKKKTKSILPKYNSTEKLNQRSLSSNFLFKHIKTALDTVGATIPETLPAALRKKYALSSRREALHAIHLSDDFARIQNARTSLKFEELFYTQIKILRTKATKEKSKGFVFDKIGAHFHSFFNTQLEFELTGAQKRVVKEIRSDLKKGMQMNRLLQGDVGSGKTIVALLSILMALDNQYQAAIMAPTEILAKQHYASFSKIFEALGIQVCFLSGSTKTKERKAFSKGLAEGEISVIVGTHALLEESVEFKNLGLVVIDEQHKFGVAQRAKLWKKNPKGLPHILVMTATPIPRTLAMTLYGDLDISVIDQMPAGRKPVKTQHYFEKSRLKLFGELKAHLAQNRQIYIVYPLIEESKTLDYQNLMDGYDTLLRVFPLPEYKMSILHGRMKPAEKEFEMARFVKADTQIMVSTTVIEVGVNVPNASVMVIENAEKFGLSQLHQLRGRVGRGSAQSYCYLMSSYKLSENAKKRLSTMCETNDGFKIAEQDLKLRGPGDLMGTKQSGVLDFKLASLIEDEELVMQTREAAQKVLEHNLLEREDFHMVKANILKDKQSLSWSRIS